MFEIETPSHTTTEITNTHAVINTMLDGVSESTQKAYAQALRTMNSYYSAQGWTFYPVDETKQLNSSRFLEQVLSYLRHLADEGKTLSTINKTLSAVKHLTSFENPTLSAALFTKPVKAFMSGLARQKKTHLPRKAEAFTVAELSRIYKHLDAEKSVRHIRDKAVIALGVAAALRSSSIGLLTLSDVALATTIDGLNVRVRFSKTDQTGKGTYIPVARASKKRLDPVAAVNEWVKVLAAFGYTKDTHPDFPLFPVIRGQRGLQDTEMLNPNITITNLLRDLLLEVELRTVEGVKAISSHSLRSTFITLSNQAGVAEKDIAVVSGHKDMNTLRSYDRTTAERSAQADYLTV